MMCPKQSKATATFVSLTALVVSALFTPNLAAQETCTVPPPGLVSWWTGDADASDRQGNNDGGLTGGAAVGAPGFVGGAFDLDGIDDRIVTTDPDVNLSNLTIAAWINPAVLKHSRIATKFNGTGSAAGSWVFDFFSDGGLRFIFGDAAGGRSQDPYMRSQGGTVVVGSWQLVAATYDGVTVSIYHNAAPVLNIAVNKGSLAAFSQEIVIGEDDPVNVQEFFGGLIDEVTLFDRALGQSELQEIFDAGSAGMCKQECGDGVVEGTEECDDGNTDDGDCCAATCRYEPAGSQTCGVGACEVTVAACDGGTPVTCVPFGGAAADATCDGVDDDCDGVADEDYVSEATACGVGECVSAGMRSCESGSVVDNCSPGIPSDEVCDGLDNDCDGSVDDGADTDGDSTPDICDPCPMDVENDSDGDSICEVDDNCDNVLNPSQSDIDGDLVGDLCDPDIDGDGIQNALDNCQYDANPDQDDFDGDGAGDVCDLDSDSDGVADADDACVPTLIGEVVNSDGCSVRDLVPCDVPYATHGDFVKQRVNAARTFKKAGLITGAQLGQLASDAAQSTCPPAP